MRSIRLLLTATAVVLLLRACSSPQPSSKSLNLLPDRSPKPCVSNTKSSVASPAPTATAAPDVVQAEAVAMPEAQFWSYIALAKGRATETGYKRIRLALEKLTVPQIMGFDARMTLALYALDDECRAVWYSKHAPGADGSVDDDGFLYARADTVTAGQATWQKAATTDTLPWGKTGAEDEESEDLLYVGGDAAHKLGMSIDAFGDQEVKLFELDYNTGANPAGWPPQPTPAPTDDSTEPASS